MGLLDNLGGLAGQLGGLQGSNTGGDPKAALIQAVLGMLVQGQAGGSGGPGGSGGLGGLGGLGGAGGLGGLAGLLQRFQGAGLGNAASSWVGTGDNEPVSPDQVRTALGDGPLRTLAEHAGVGEDEAASHLSGLLPQMVDRLTPNGQVPAGGVHEGGLAGAVEALGQLLGRR